MCCGGWFASGFQVRQRRAREMITDRVGEGQDGGKDRVRGRAGQGGGRQHAG